MSMPGMNCIWMWILWALSAVHPFIAAFSALAAQVIGLSQESLHLRLRGSKGFDGRVGQVQGEPFVPKAYWPNPTAPSAQPWGIYPIP